jgi:hypothetical protein
MNIPDNYIKLRIPGEKFWAESISPNSAIIKNILVNPEYGLNDIVAHDGENVTCLLVKKTETATLTYNVPESIDEKVLIKTVNDICQYFENKHDFQVEPVFLGKILIAIPVGTPRQALLSVIEDCPHKVTIDFPDDDEEDDSWI